MNNGGFSLQSQTSIDTQISIYPDLECTDEVLLEEKIWKDLQTNETGVRLAIAITPAARFITYHVNSFNLQSITCWTRPSNVTGLVIPERWISEYPYLFPPVHVATSFTSNLTHTIVVVHPFKLSELFILPDIQYETCEQAISEILASLSLSKKIIRRNTTFSVPSLNANLAANSPSLSNFCAISTEPVLQGYVDAAHTRLILLRDYISRLSEPVTNGSLYETSEFLIESESDDFEIGQNFLENTRELFPPILVSSQEETLDRSSITVLYQSLTRQINQWEGCGIDSEASLFLSGSLLNQVGVFDGDWGIVSDEKCRHSRLCRLFILNSRTGFQCFGSPILLGNVATPSKSDVQVIIQPSGFGQDLPIPTARTVTVARIASPLSNDRTYQEFFLQSLKHYFKFVKRLVKKGDLLAIPLHTELAALVKRCGADEIDTEVHSTFLDSFNYGTKATGVVFFRVTNVEFEVMHTQDSCPDSYMAATLGELGCWVDIAYTKMTQVGVEHSRVIDVAPYLNISVFPRLEPLAGSQNPRISSELIRLWKLTEATLHPLASTLNLPTSILLRGCRGVGKFTWIKRLAQTLGIHLLEGNCYNILGDTDVKTEGILRALFDKAIASAPCILSLRYLEALCKIHQPSEAEKEHIFSGLLLELLSDLKAAWRSSNHPVILIASTSEAHRIPIPVIRAFKHEINLEAPTETERLDLLYDLTQNLFCSPDVSLKNVAIQTAALLNSDLVQLIDKVQTIALERSLDLNAVPGITQSDIRHAGIVITHNDFTRAISIAKTSYAENIGAPKIPAVSWNDVGGLNSVKSDILDTIQLPLEHPELFVDGLKKRSGILLYGPPGTGKTLLAKAVATSCSLNFLSVKGPELLNMYIGESESNVRRIFQKAREAKPCIIFFDELDSIAPKRGNYGDSGGVMDRIVSQLLAELDGMVEGKDGANVFVIGATNRPDLLDPALLRPGRFDRLLYLGLSDTHEDQLHILQALTRNFPLDPNLDLMDIASLCPFDFTGADFYALCSDAMLKAMSRKAEDIDKKIDELNSQSLHNKTSLPLTAQYYLDELASPSDMEVVVSQKDFQAALNELKPSVSREELAQYAAVQQQFTHAPSSTNV